MLLPNSNCIAFLESLAKKIEMGKYSKKRILDILIDYKHVEHSKESELILNNTERGPPVCIEASSLPVSFIMSSAIKGSE